MTTHSDVRQIEPYWFTRPEAEIRAAAEAAPETWATVPGYSRYEWSDKGRLRRVRDGYIMKVGGKLNNSGYVLVNVTSDSGRPVTVAAAPMVLLAHHPAFRGLDKFPGGLETRHNPAVGDKTFNAYPWGIWPGTKVENADDKYRHGQPRTPAATHPCINHVRCGGLVVNQGRRCLPCAREVGVEAAAMLNAGINLEDVTARLGYQTTEWVWKLARNHGGYTGTLAVARSQRPPWSRRVTYRAAATLRSLFRPKER
jgi:hypothetical protein